MPRLDPKLRKDQLLVAALEAARKSGYNHITRREIAIIAGTSEALISRHWGTMNQVRRAVMRRAIIDKDVTVLAQGLSARDPVAMKASPELRAKAAASLV